MTDDRDRFWDEDREFLKEYMNYHKRVGKPPELCGTCDGSGLTAEEVPGGVFDTRMGQFYPAERSVTCPDCDGTGDALDRLEGCDPIE